MQSINKRRTELLLDIYEEKIKRDRNVYNFLINSTELKELEKMNQRRNKTLDFIKLIPINKDNTQLYKKSLSKKSTNDELNNILTPILTKKEYAIKSHEYLKNLAKNLKNRNRYEQFDFKDIFSSIDKISSKSSSQYEFHINLIEADNRQNSLLDSECYSSNTNSLKLDINSSYQSSEIYTSFNINSNTDSGYSSFNSQRNCCNIEASNKKINNFKSYVDSYINKNNIANQSITKSTFLIKNKNESEK